MRNLKKKKKKKKRNFGRHFETVKVISNLFSALWKLGNLEGVHSSCNCNKVVSDIYGKIELSVDLKKIK